MVRTVRRRRPTYTSPIARRTSMAATAAVLALLLAGCSGGSDGSNATTTPGAGGSGAQPSGEVVAGGAIHTTTAVWSEVVSRLACYDGAPAVVPMIEAGADPHGSSLSLADRDALDDAVLVVANGAGLEPDLDRLVDSVDADVVVLFDQLDPARRIDDNPHIWLDPTVVADLVDPLVGAMDAAGLDPEALASCADEFRSDLADLDADITATLAPVPADCRAVITDHRTLDYFARRYDIDIVGTVVDANSSMAEAGLAHLDELAQQATGRCVPAVLIEAGEEPESALAFARRLDVPAVPVPIESVGHSLDGADVGYLAGMENTASIIATALGAEVE